MAKVKRCCLAGGESRHLCEGRPCLLGPREPAWSPAAGTATEGWFPPRASLAGALRRPCAANNSGEVLGEAGEVQGWTLTVGE